MRVYGPAGIATAPAGPSARRVSSGGFTLGEAEQPRASREGGGPRAVGGIEALMAMQGVEDVTERRRRAVRRGRSALDALDGLKLALLEGRLDGLALNRLRAAATAMREASGDPRIDAVLAEIDLRVEVELAKIGMPGPA